MMRLAGVNDPLLGRPLALYDVVADAAGESTAVDIVYLAVGRMTRRLAALPAGANLEVWGPLGNGFPPLPAQHLVMVAGGIGQTPFLALAREHLGLCRYGDPPRQLPRAGKVTLCYGCRSSEYLAGLDDFRRVGVESTAEHRRWLGRPAGLGDGLDTPGGRAIHAALPPGLLRSEGDVVSHGRVGRAAGRALPGFLGDAYGLRHRHLLQLRGEGP